MIAVEDQATAGTLVYPLVQGHCLPMVTPAAILTRISRVDFDKLAPSLFRFGSKFVEELRPGGVMNAFGKTVIMGHAVDTQVFHANDPEAVYDVPAFLVREVVAPEADTLMYPRHGLAVFAPFGGAFGKLAMLALDFGKRLLFFAKEAWVGNHFPCREGRKGLETHINPYLLRVRRQAFGLTLDREASIPFAGTALVNGERLDLAAYRAMVDHLDAAYFGETHAVIVGDGKARLRKGEGVIAAFALKAGIAWVLCMLTHPAKECFESEIDTDRNMLQDLRMHLRERRAFLLQYRKRVDLPIAGERLPILLPSSTPFLKQVIIEPTTFFKDVVQLLFLLLAWIDAILKHFMHILFISTKVTGSQAGTRSTPAPKKERALYPWGWKPRVLRRGSIKFRGCLRRLARNTMPPAELGASNRDSLNGFSKRL